MRDTEDQYSSDIRFFQPNLLNQSLGDVYFTDWNTDLQSVLLKTVEIGIRMTSEDSTEGNEANPIVKAWGKIRSDITTEQIQEVIHFEDGRPKIDPTKAKQLAHNQNSKAIHGATGGAIVGALISVSGVLTIPLAAAGAALGFAMDRNKVDQVEVLEEDFEEILEAIEDEEQVDLSRLAMITHIKKETLSSDYLPYLEEQGFIDYDEKDERIRYSEPILQQAASYIGR